MATTNASQQEESYDDTPSGWQRRWQMELETARKYLDKWHRSGERANERYLDQRKDSRAEQQRSDEARWNLFSSNVNTLRAFLFGQTPKVQVSRRFADFEDDDARIAGELLERLLNTDIERAEDGYCAALRNALDDRLIPGLGFARCRYEADIEQGEETPAKTRPGPDGQPVELAPAVPGQERVAREDVATDYIHWRDVLWSPARTFEEWRWAGFCNPMTRDQLVERFGENIGRQVPLNSKNGQHGGQPDESDAKRADPWARADVWEIWDKEHKRVWWVVEGAAAPLDSKDDPYGLAGFWPFPAPLIANVTTSAFVPRNDYALAQDLYDEIDLITTRINKLERAVRVVGVYDKTAAGIQRMLKEATDNELIPVENWAVFADKGGVKGQIDWLPLEMIVAALDKLREYRTELIGALYQITGMSDVVRGQQTENGTPGEAQVKARFSSVRLQALQDEFARFASDLQRIKAEMISKLFQPETIAERSNAKFLAPEDAEHVQSAIALLKTERFGHYRVQVKPEAVSLTDFAALKSERTEMLASLVAFMQAAAPVAQQIPGSLPFMLQFLQWSVAGMRGASTIEGVIDRAITQAEQMPPQQQQGPDPKMLAAQAKQQADQQKAALDMQREQQKHVFDMERIAAETEANRQRQADQTRFNVMEDVARAHLKQSTSPGPVPAFGPEGGQT